MISDVLDNNSTHMGVACAHPSHHTVDDKIVEEYDMNI